MRRRARSKGKAWRVSLDRAHRTVQSVLMPAVLRSVVFTSLILAGCGAPAPPDPRAYWRHGGPIRRGPRRSTRLTSCPSVSRAHRPAGRPGASKFIPSRPHRSRSPGKGRTSHLAGATPAFPTTRTTRSTRVSSKYRASTDRSRVRPAETRPTRSRCRTATRTCWSSRTTASSRARTERPAAGCSDPRARRSAARDSSECAPRAADSAYPSSTRSSTTRGLIAFGLCRSPSPERMKKPVPLANRSVRSSNAISSSPSSTYPTWPVTHQSCSRSFPSSSTRRIFRPSRDTLLDRIPGEPVSQGRSSKSTRARRLTVFGAPDDGRSGGSLFPGATARVPFEARETLRTDAAAESGPSAGRRSRFCSASRRPRSAIDRG